jgi:hypothetical protein
MRVLQTVCLGICVWVIWMFIVAELMPRWDRDLDRDLASLILAMIVALAATVLTIYVFNRFTRQKSD